MKYLFTTLLAASLSLPVVAQDESGTGYEREGRKGQHRGQREKRGNPAQHLTRELGLSDEQSVQLEAIFETSRAEREALRDAGQEEHCALRQATEAEIATVLTAEQFQQMEAMRGEREGKEDGRGRRGGRPPIDCGV